MDRRNFVSPEDILENIETMNEEFVDEAKAKRFLQFQNASERAYKEKIQLEEANTLATVYSKLVSAGVIAKKKPKTLEQMSRVRKIKPSDRVRVVNNKVTVAPKPLEVAPQPLPTSLPLEDKMEAIKRPAPRPIGAPAQAPIQTPVVRQVPPRPVVTAASVQPVAKPVPVPAAIEEANESLMDALNAITVEPEEPEQEEVYEEEEVEEEVEPVGPSDEQVRSEILKRHGVTNEMLDAWKREKGPTSVYCLFIGEGELYLFTHLRRAEHREILAKSEEISKSKDPKVVARAEEKLQELVVRNCLLFPRPQSINFETERAGLVSVLFSSIWTRSLFLSNEQIKLLTVTL